MCDACRRRQQRLTRRCARSKRVVTFANQADFISFRHHMYEQPRGAKSVAIKEARAATRLRCLPCLLLLCLRS